MRANSKYSVFVSLISLFFFQLAVSANSLTTPRIPDEHGLVDAKSESTPIISEDLEIAFPDIDGWEKGEVKRYPRKELGYMVNYESREGGRISVYVYNPGLKKIPDGVKSRAVKKELKNAEQGIYVFGERGYYENVKKVKQDTVSFNGRSDGIQSLRSLFNFSSRDTKLTSEILLFGYKNHFIKFRATRLRDKVGVKNEALATFWSAMDSLFSGKPITSGNSNSGSSDDAEISFPDIDGWEKGEIKRFPRKELGYMVNYESREGGRITVYVYNPGLKNIPNGFESRVVKEEVKNAEQGLYIFEERGYYKNVKKIKEDTISFNGQSDGIISRRSLFNFSADGDDLTSEVYVFGYKNQFIKFRATRLRERNGVRNEAVVSFFKAMNAVFSK